jgi:hypothetical protein
MSAFTAPASALAPARAQLRTSSASKTLIGARAAAPARRVASARRAVVTSATATPFDNLKFAPIRESEVSRAMSSRCVRARARFLHPCCSRV